MIASPETTTKKELLRRPVNISHKLTAQAETEQNNMEIISAYFSRWGKKFHFVALLSFREMITLTKKEEKIK